MTKQITLLAKKQQADSNVNPAAGELTEIWKPFPQLESQFEISNFGKVRCLQTWQPVRTRINKGFEVLAVGRKIDGKLYRPAIHRAVALAFVPNPNGYQCARAIDKTKPLTHATNLKWEEKRTYLGRGRVRPSATGSLAWYRLRPDRPTLPPIPVNQAYTNYLLDILVSEGRLTKYERLRTGIVSAEDDSMAPRFPQGVEFVATPVSPNDYSSLIGKVVAVVVKAQRFAYYLGRVVSIDEDFVHVSRDNSEWSDRIESRSVIASIARVVSVLETSVI